MSDLISRQAAISAVNTALFPKINTAKDAEKALLNLPSAEPTLYGYRIEHLALIARVMQKENVTPEKAIECFKDVGRIVQMIMDEQKEAIKKAVEQCMT